MKTTLGSVLAAPALSGALVLIVKVTLLIAAGAAIAMLLRRRSAAARHFVWALTLAGTLAVALLTPIAPRLPVRILKAPVTSPDLAVARGAGGDIAATVADPATAVPAPSSAGHVASRNAGRAASHHETAVAPLHAPAASTANPIERHAALISPWTLGAWSAALWLGGALAVLLWCGLGRLGLARLARRALPIEGEAWRALLEAARVQTGVRRSLRLGRATAVGAPVTWGWSRPVILFPIDVESWPLERRRVALLHELAHVARNDYVTQLIASAACALYWFMPPVWLAARRLRVESEHACDDRVLSGGTPAGEYASHLLAVARGARDLRLGGAVAVSMARRSYLEGRLLAVLDETRVRHMLSRGAAAAALAALMLALVPLAGLEPAAATAPTASSTPTATTAPTSSATPAVATAPTAAVPTTSSTPEIATTAPAALSAVVAAATVRTFMDDRHAPKAASFERQGGTIERDLPATPGEQLHLDLLTGAEVEVQGWDEPRVTVRGRLASNDTRDTHVTIERTSGGVRVRAIYDGHQRSYSSSHEFVIRVPRRYDVYLQSAGGGVKIVNVDGNFRGVTGGGPLVLQHVKGQAHLSTGGGDIEVSDSDLGGSVNTGGGMVKISRVSGGLRGNSGSGPVIYADRAGASDRSDFSGRSDPSEPTGDLTNLRSDESDDHVAIARGDTRGMLHIDKAGGDVDLDEAPDGARITTGGGDIHLGRAGGNVSARTGGGDIDIGPVAGSVHAGTGAGTVHVRLTDAGGKAQEVGITSGTGKVIVELPANFDGRFEVETAYTKSLGRATRIASPWALERESTTMWDGKEGTPRRYVRARGTVGQGRGMINIHTVNGDIELRKAGE